MARDSKGNVDEPKGGDDKLFAWVADFEEGEPEQPRKPRRPLVPALIGGSAFVVLGSVILAAFLRPFEVENGLAGEEAPRPSASAPSSTVAPSEPEEPGEPVESSAMPASCDDLYGKDMLKTLDEAGLHLNQVWTGVREASAGSRDDTLKQYMAAAPTSIDCFWLDDEGGGKHAVLTSVSEVTPESAAAIEARLVAIGQSKANDRHGLRYFTEFRSGQEVGGEAHYLRGGLWFATHWYGTGPFGYTTHMADQVF